MHGNATLALALCEREGGEEGAPVEEQKKWQSS